MGPVLVMRRPLCWDGRRLGYGPPVPRQAAAGFVTGLRPGNWVSLHWDCVCDRLSQQQLLALRRFIARHLLLVNAARRKGPQTRLRTFVPSQARDSVPRWFV